MMDFTDMFKSAALAGGEKGPGGLADNMNFINHSLRTYGLPSPLPFGSTNDRDVGIVLDAVYRLLQQRRSDAATVDSLRLRVTREERENARLRAEREQAQGRYAALDQSKALLEARVGKQKAAFAREKAALEHRVEQLEKRCLQLQHRDAQYLAAAKRQEREFARLQKQLKTAAGARDRDTKQRMELAQKLQAPGAAGGARRGWKAARGTAKEDLAASLVASYEEREKAFLAENDQLRGALRALQEELCGAIAAHKRAHASMRQREAEAEAAIERAGAVAQSESDHASDAAGGGDDLEIEVLPAGQFALPLDWAKDSVVSALRAQAGRLAQLARAVDADTASQSEPAPTEPAAGAARELQAAQSRAVKLEASLARAKAIIRDQDVLLRAALLEGCAAAPLPLLSVTLPDASI